MWVVSLNSDYREDIIIFDKKNMAYECASREALFHTGDYAKAHEGEINGEQSQSVFNSMVDSYNSMDFDKCLELYKEWQMTLDRQEDIFDIGVHERQVKAWSNGLSKFEKFELKMEKVESSSNENKKE